MSVDSQSSRFMTKQRLNQAIWTILVCCNFFIIFYSRCPKMCKNVFKAISLTPLICSINTFQIKAYYFLHSEEIWYTVLYSYNCYVT